MNDQDLRALVRQAVQRHVGGTAGPDPAPRASAPTAVPAAARHVSHGVYVTLVNTTDQCLIEPAVPCEHCGYCKTHGY